MTGQRVLSRAGGPLAWLGSLVLLYLAIPVVAFFVRLAGSHQSGFTAPGLFPALWVSCLTATISVALIALFGIPLAWVLAHSRRRLATVVGAAVYLPLAVPPLISGILLIYLVGPYTLLGRTFDRRLTDSLVGVVLAQTFVAAPFLIVSARAAFAAEDPGLEEVAAALGHRPIARFLRVGVPVAGPGIRAGLLLAWLRAFGEYGATVLLAYHPSSLPIYTYTQFSGSGLANTEAPTALALVVAAVVVTIGRVRLPRRRRSRAALPAPAVPGPGAPVSVRFELEVKAGTFRLGATHRASTHRLAILGPSGSGKSLTLRSIAGLLGADAGPVWYGADPVRYEPVESRQIGYVPQGYQLIPHLNVRDQVCFGVGADPALASYWLETFRLGALIDRLPQELSGGQRQRVCLAQALARKPRLILLDEPFSALDAPVRAELQQELRRLQHRVGLSSVLVTHDPEEAALLADEILVLLEGRLVQSGTPGDLHGRPAGPEVARLLGISNVFSGHTGPDGRLEAAGLRLGVAAGDSPPGTRVQWCIHPEHVDVGSSGAYLAEVVDAADLGPATALELRLGSGLMIRARCSKRRSWSPGEECRVDLPPDAITVWPDGRAGDASALDPGSLDGRFVGP